MNAFLNKIIVYPIKSLDGIEISFADLGSSKLGQASKRDKWIEIDRNFYQKSTEWQIEVVVWHELAHVVYQKDHNDDLVGEHPVSIMHPSPLLCPSHLRQWYIQELFSVN